jgi:hypothetical protein
MKEKIKRIVRQILSWLAMGDFAKLVELTKGVRMSDDEITTAIRDYAKTLCIPPEHAFDLMDVVTVRNAAIPQFSVRIPLWTKEEGRSDLTLELTIKMPDKSIEVELDDIHVL